jgi:hypothetical protein
MGYCAYLWSCLPDLEITSLYSSLTLINSLAAIDLVSAYKPDQICMQLTR